MATVYTHGVQCSPDDVIADTRKVFNAATADEHNRVLLQIVSDTWNIGGYLNPIGQSHTSHLPQRRVGLLGSLCVDTNTDASFLGTALQRRALCFDPNPFSPFAN
jgi:hypothetical protein